MHITTRSGRRTLAGLVAAVIGAATLAATPAVAADRPPETGEGAVTITSSLITTAGSTISFEGSGYGVGTTNGSPSWQKIFVKIDDGAFTTGAAGNGTYGSFQVDPDGTFEGSFTLPATLPTGTHWLRFLGSNPVTSKVSQDFTVVDTSTTAITTTVTNGGRGNPAGSTTINVAGAGLLAGETLTAKVDGADKAFTAPVTVANDGTVTGAKLQFLAGTITAGTHEVVIVRGSGLPSITKSVVVNPTVAWSSLSQNSEGALTLCNLAEGAVISGVSFGDAVFTGLPVTAASDGTATVAYTLSSTAALGTLPWTITQTGPAETYTGTAKVSPSAAAFGTDLYNRVETPVGTIQQGLYQSAYSAASDSVFATSANVTTTSTIYKLDPKTLAVKASIVPAFVNGTDGALYAAYGVGVDDKNGTVWVTQTRQNTIAVYRQSDLSLVKQFPAGEVNHSRDVLADPAHNRVYVSSASEGSSGDGYISVYDGTTLELVKKIETGPRATFSPMSLALDSVAGKVYSVSNSSDNAVAIDTTSLEFTMFDLNLPTGAKASGVAVDPATNRLFVASQGTDDLTIFNATTGALLHDVATGAGALNVTWDPVKKRAYVANFGGTTVSVVDTNGTLVANLPFARANHLSTDGKGAVYVVNKATDNQVIRLEPKPVVAPPTTQPTTPPVVTPPTLPGPAPKVSGAAKVGKKLKAKVGTWPSGTKVTYRWYVGGKVVGKSSTLKLKKAWRGKKLVLKVTGAKPGYASSTRTSKAVKIKR